VILESLTLSPDDLERRTGWSIRPEGACKGDVCVPLPDGALDARVLSERLRMPLVGDEAHGVWALGPESLGGRALTTAVVPDITLPDRNGEPFALRSLRGQKVFLLAWASW
jgi:hypothetical protein